MEVTRAILNLPWVMLEFSLSDLGACVSDLGASVSDLEGSVNDFEVCVSDLGVFVKLAIARPIFL